MKYTACKKALRLLSFGLLLRICHVWILLALVARLTGYPRSSTRLFLAVCAVDSDKPIHLQYRGIKDIGTHAYGMVSPDTSVGVTKSESWRAEAIRRIWS